MDSRSLWSGKAQVKTPQAGMKNQYVHSCVRLKQPLLKVDQTCVPLKQPLLKVDQTCVPLKQPLLKVDQTWSPLKQPVLKVDQTWSPLKQPVLKVDQTWSPLKQPVLKVDQTWSPLKQPVLKVDQTWSPLKQPVLKVDQTWSPLKQPVLKVDQTWSPLKQPVLKIDQTWSCSTNMSHGPVDFTEDVFEAEDTDGVSRKKTFERVSPVELLSRLEPGLSFSCVCERPPGGAVRSFVMVLQVHGRVFEGSGRSKGVAKARAAACALSTLYRPHPGLRGGTNLQLPQLFAEAVSELVTQKYQELILSSSSAPPPLHSGLAGIVLTSGYDLRSAQVVAMATGTKYYDVDLGPEQGLEVRDCHAEALSRRALLCFFYDQLELLTRIPSDAAAHSIFVPVSGEGAVFRLRNDLHLHMFLRCPPCGDARLHCPYSRTQAPGTATRTRRWRCGVRVKVNGGEGTVPVSQTGTPPQSMSCSDKLAKWCVVGLQGALLSHLVEPIYLQSVTIAGQSHPGHMGRVLWRRLGPVRRLQAPYRRRLVLLGCVDRRYPPSCGQGAHTSLSWTWGQGSEVIRASSGRQAHSGTPSRLCPAAMFLRWSHVNRKVKTPPTGHIQRPRWRRWVTSVPCVGLVRGCRRRGLAGGIGPLRVHHVMGPGQREMMSFSWTILLDSRLRPIVTERLQSVGQLLLEQAEDTVTAGVSLKVMQ